MPARRISKTLARTFYEQMLRTYLFEETLHSLYRQGQLFGGLYTGSGNEAVSIGATLALGQDDVVAPSHRGMGAHFIRGETFQGMLLQLMARAEGGTRGRDNAAHQGSMKRGVLAMISHLATMPAIAAGCALAHRVRGEKRVALAFIGEGSTSLGDCHETLNLASVLNLPFVLVIENNQWAYSTPTKLQYKCKQLSGRAQAYGISGVTIDGTDVELVYKTTKAAVERARAGKGPSIIETITMRLRGHSAADMAEYVPQAELRHWQKRHPVTRYESVLLRRGWIRKSEISQLKTSIQAEIDVAQQYAQSSAHPIPESCTEGVYAP